MRDCSPGPADMRNASSAENATTARKSRDSAPGTCAGCQSWPSVVRRYVPWVPEAQAIFFDTALTPRKLSVVWVGRICGADCARAVAVTRMIGSERMQRLSQEMMIDDRVIEGWSVLSVSLPTHPQRLKPILTSNFLSQR